MRTSSEFGNAEVQEDTYHAIKSTLTRLDSVIVPVITGFVGHDTKVSLLLPCFMLDDTDVRIGTHHHPGSRGIRFDSHR